jgi:hypothetical protein
MNDCNLFKGKNNGTRIMKPAAKIQAEFDRIALAEDASGWNRNNHYHDFLLRRPAPRRACHPPPVLALLAGLGEACVRN